MSDVAPAGFLRREPPLFTELGRRLAGATHAPFAVRLSDGVTRRFGVGAPAFTLVSNTERGDRALASFDDLSVVNAYLHGHVDVEGDLYALIGYRFLLSDRRPLQYLWETYLQPLVMGQVEADKHTIPAHYDLPPEFFELWLDDHVRAYSHGHFESDDEPLWRGMERKLQFAVDACKLKPGDRVLDIGGGWGSFAQYGGERGLRVTSITISDVSEKYLKALNARRGFANTVIKEHFLELDVKEGFDAIVNLGVTEHLPDYARSIAQYQRLLKPTGRVYLDAYSGRRFQMSSFVTRWVYEGNTSPLNLKRYMRALEDSDLEVMLVQDDAHNYSLSCRKWAENLERNRHAIIQRWGELLYRRFRLYLWGCAHCFDHGRLGAHRMVLEHLPGLRRRRRWFGVVDEQSWRR
jgi:cyclopropane-fatty-acyl-phospholipid synthase